MIGGTGADTVTLTVGIANGSIDLGSGADKLTLSALANSVTLANVETVIGQGEVQPTPSPSTSAP